MSTTAGFGGAPRLPSIGAAGATAAGAAQLAGAQATGAGAQQVARGAQQVGAGAAQTGAAGAQQLGAGAAQPHAGAALQQPRCLTLRYFTRGAQVLQPPQLETAGAPQPQLFFRENRPASTVVAAISNATVAITNPRTIIISLQKTPRSICKTVPKKSSPGGCHIIPSSAGVHAKRTDCELISRVGHNNIDGNSD